ncbi:MAG TPA: type II secretion system ATPase GspE [Rhizomicrobium sp.]|jgi:general secretion pathway protein E
MVAQFDTFIVGERHPVRDALAQRLLETGKLAPAGLERAARLSDDSGERLEIVLARLGLASERDIAETLAAILDLPVAALDNYPAAPILEDRLSQKFLKEARIIPLADRAESVAIAMVDPLNDYAAEAAAFAADKPVLRFIAYPADFEAVYDRLYGGGKSEIRQISEETRARDDIVAEEDVDRIKDSASEAPVIRLVNLLITRAVEARASDIHIEPMNGELLVRYRIDGVLQEVESPPARLSGAIVSRVKIMAALNIAERRMAQDGRIRLAVRGKDIDFRVSTMPTIHGESVVMRILDRGNLTLDFDALGFDADITANIRELLSQPHGILLVTGPTGSGKTTTLYTGLLELNTRDKKLLTIEDPVEYQLAGVNQVQVKPQIGLTFAGALRSFLRQDPDIMMVGEIRDLETAQVAVQAALTGHLILSTLHTNDAASAITRLLDMGIEDFLLTSTINGLVAQRLVRTLCPHCRECSEALPDFARKMQFPQTGAPAIHYRARGCAHCGGTGYFGRSSIVEVLTMSDAVRALVLAHADTAAIRVQAIRDGMQTMHAHGMKKVVAGSTSVEEVLRATRAV